MVSWFISAIRQGQVTITPMLRDQMKPGLELTTPEYVSFIHSVLPGGRKYGKLEH